MTEEQSKRREFLPLVFIVNSFKKPLQKSLQISAFHCYRGKKTEFLTSLLYGKQVYLAHGMLHACK